MEGPSQSSSSEAQAPIPFHSSENLYSYVKNLEYAPSVPIPMSSIYSLLERNDRAHNCIFETFVNQTVTRKGFPKNFNAIIAKSGRTGKNHVIYGALPIKRGWQLELPFVNAKFLNVDYDHLGASQLSLLYIFISSLFVQKSSSTFTADDSLLSQVQLLEVLVRRFFAEYNGGKWKKMNSRSLLALFPVELQENQEKNFVVRRDDKYNRGAMELIYHNLVAKLLLLKGVNSEMKFNLTTLRVCGEAEFDMKDLAHRAEYHIQSGNQEPFKIIPPKPRRRSGKRSKTSTRTKSGANQKDSESGSSSGSNRRRKTGSSSSRPSANSFNPRPNQNSNAPGAGAAGPSNTQSALLTVQDRHLLTRHTPVYFRVPGALFYEKFPVYASDIIDLLENSSSLSHKMFLMTAGFLIRRKGDRVMLCPEFADWIQSRRSQSFVRRTFQNWCNESIRYMVIPLHHRNHTFLCIVYGFHSVIRWARSPHNLPTGSCPMKILIFDSKKTGQHYYFAKENVVPIVKDFLNYKARRMGVSLRDKTPPPSSARDVERNAENSIENRINYALKPLNVMSTPEQARDSSDGGWYALITLKLLLDEHLNSELLRLATQAFTYVVSIPSTEHRLNPSNELDRLYREIRVKHVRSLARYAVLTLSNIFPNLSKYDMLKREWEEYEKYLKSSLTIFKRKN